MDINWQNVGGVWILIMRSLNWISDSWISHECAAWMGNLAEIQWLGSPESRSIHLLEFVFILWCFCFFNISIKVVRHFSYTKNGIKLITSCTLFIGTTLFRKYIVWHHCKYPFWCRHNGEAISRQWHSITMGSWWLDVATDTKQSCHQQLGSFTQDPSSGKTWTFHLKHSI